MIKSVRKDDGHGPGGCRGFTLLEVIISILVAAVLGTILVQYMSSGLSSSVVSLNNIKDDYVLEQVIEAFTRDYRYWLENDPNQTITNFKTDYIDKYINGQISVLTGAGKTEIVSNFSAGDDAAGVQVLRVTVSDGTRTLSTLFTK